jgi:hypothetical protein
LFVNADQTCIGIVARQRQTSVSNFAQRLSRLNYKSLLQSSIRSLSSFPAKLRFCEQMWHDGQASSSDLRSSDHYRGSPSQLYGTAGVLFQADENLVMKLFQAQERWRVVLLGLVLAGGSIVIFRSETPFIPIQSSVQFLSADTKIPPQPVSLFERWVPISRVWLWRLRDGIRGPLATILIDAKIIDCTGLSERAMAGLLPEPALAETNGLRGWILNDPALTGLKRQLEQMGGRVIMNPRVQTAHAIQASMSVGNTILVSGVSVQVGLVLDLLPLIQPDGTELMSVFALTEAITNRSSGVLEGQATVEPTGTGDTSIVTNLASAARWKLPDGTGFFMLGPGASNDSRRIGVIVSATVQRPKK